MKEHAGEFRGATAEFAWDGFGFRLPAPWNLASYTGRGGVCKLDFEDDYSVRLQVETTRPRHAVNIATVQERFTKAARPLTRTATANAPCEKLPPAWTGHKYRMPDGHVLLTAFHLAPQGRFFAFLRLYFSPEDKEAPEAVVRLIAATFRRYTGDVPWRVYDVDITVPARFRLAATALEAGRKLMIFHWGLRRLLVWHFSLAHLFLKDTTAAAWGAEFLNGYRGLKGPLFHAADGQIAARRSRRYALGHFEEIGRLCFRYVTGFRQDREKDQLVLWVFQYRHRADLAGLPTLCRESVMNT